MSVLVRTAPNKNRVFLILEILVCVHSLMISSSRSRCGCVKPLMREAGYGRNTITRVLPEAAKFKSRGKPVSTKMVQNVIAAEEIQPEISKQQQVQQTEQQPYLYPCTCCDKDAIISEAGNLPDNGILMKAVHLDKSIEDHTWPTYDLLGVIGENTAAPKSQQQKQLKRYKVEMKATVHVEVESEDEVKDRTLETLRLTGDLLTPIQWRVTLIKDSIVETSPLQ